MFWIHIGSFAVHDALTGYLLLHRLNAGLEALFLFACAMAVHFVINDYNLRRDDKGRYRRIGRWSSPRASSSGGPWAPSPRFPRPRSPSSPPYSRAASS